MDLSGRKAVVTGGGRGIGEAVARALVEAGAAVVVAARTTEEIEAVAAGLRDGGHDARAVRCDVTDPASVEALAGDAGDVDILVNNAGVSGSAPVHRTTLEDWNRCLAVNATGTFLCMRAFLPGMHERGRGRIVNVASVAGLSGGRYIGAYAASKHAVIGLTRSAAAEAAGKGITVNAVCPAYVDTVMAERAVRTVVERAGVSEERALEMVLATTGQPRLVTTGEVAHAVLALCDDAAASINGQAIVVDGGGLLA